MRKTSMTKNHIFLRRFDEFLHYFLCKIHKKEMCKKFENPLANKGNLCYNKTKNE